MKKTGEDILRENLIPLEAEFQNSDWESMAAMLDQENPVPPVAPSDSKNTLNHHLKQTIMTILTVTTILGILLSQPTHNDAPTVNPSQTDFKREMIIPEPTKVDPSTEIFIPTEIPEISKENNSHKINGIDVSNQITDSAQSGTFQKSTLQIPSEDKTQVNENMPSISNQLAGIPTILNPEEDSTGKQNASTDSTKFYKVVTKRYWVEDRYKYQYYRPSNDIEDFWIGIHYTQQNLPNQGLWDSIGRHKQTHGFNIQFMSGNILKGEHLGIYAGIDWGMQFYGRSDKDEVLINSGNEDRGLSFIRSHTNDFLIRSHIEYANGPVVPYINLGVGARIFSQGQTIDALLESSEYESSTQHGLMSRGSLLTTVGAGAKFRLTPRVHLDFRYEQTMAKTADVINYAATEFNGLQYDIVKTKMDLSSPQIKFGLIFDLSYEEYERVLVEEGHYEETTQELLLDQVDSEKIIIPSPCAPCRDTVRYREDQPRKSHPFDGIEDYTPINSGGSSGGGKSSFPGLKTPPIKH